MGLNPFVGACIFLMLVIIGITHWLNKSARDGDDEAGPSSES